MYRSPHPCGTQVTSLGPPRRPVSWITYFQERPDFSSFLLVSLFRNFYNSLYFTRKGSIEMSLLRKSSFYRTYAGNEVSKVFTTPKKGPYTQDIVYNFPVQRCGSFLLSTP